MYFVTLLLDPHWTYFWKHYIYSVLPIYRGRVYCGIGYIAVACWTPFFFRPRARYFSRNRGNTLDPIRDNFSRNLLTAIAFVPGSPETIFREINSGLPVNAGWNTYCAMVSQARLSIDTSIVSQSRVRLIQWQCKSRLQIANMGINNAFLIKSSLVDHAVYIRHLVQKQTVPLQIKSAWLIDILAVYAHQNKVTIMTQNGLKYDHKSAKWQQLRTPAIL